MEYTGPSILPPDYAEEIRRKISKTQSRWPRVRRPRQHPAEQRSRRKSLVWVRATNKTAPPGRAAWWRRLLGIDPAEDQIEPRDSPGLDFIRTTRTARGIGGSQTAASFRTNAREDMRR